MVKFSYTPPEKKNKSGENQVHNFYKRPVPYCYDIIPCYPAFWCTSYNYFISYFCLSYRCVAKWNKIIGGLMGQGGLIRQNYKGCNWKKLKGGEIDGYVVRGCNERGRSGIKSLFRWREQYQWMQLNRSCHEWFLIHKCSALSGEMKRRC